MQVIETISRKEFAIRSAVALAIAAGLFLAWHLGDVLMLTFGGVVLAVVIRMAADPVARLLRIRERWASVLVLLIIIALLATAFYFFGNEVVEQFSELNQRLPLGLKRIREWIGSGVGAGDGSSPVSASDLLTAASSTYNFLVDTILVLLVAVYLSFDPSRYRRGVLSLVPAAHRNGARDALATANQALRGWLRGQLVSMASVGLLTGIGLWLVGVPLALVLALIAGLLEFIPILGPVLAAVPGILLAFTVSPQAALYTALVYLVVQQLESNLITPLAQNWAVELPPALGLVGLVVMASLFGLPGLIFAAPLTVAAMVLMEHFYADQQALEK